MEKGNPVGAEAPFLVNHHCQVIEGVRKDERFGERGVKLCQNGKRMTIGAPNSVTAGGATGVTRVWEYDGTAKKWTQMGQEIEAEAADDYSGFSVDCNKDGSMIIVGAWQNAGNGTDSGHV